MRARLSTTEGFEERQALIVTKAVVKEKSVIDKAAATRQTHHEYECTSRKGASELVIKV